MSKHSKTKRSTAKHNSAAGRGPAQRRPPAVEQPSPEHEAAFVEAMIESGQAAPLTPEGTLPAGATHEIVKDDRGNVKVVRRRFSIG